MNLKISKLNSKNQNEVKIVSESQQQPIEKKSKPKFLIQIHSMQKCRK